MRRFLALLSLAITLVAYSPVPANAEDCLDQTWKGTIGAAAVMMVFDSIGEDGALAGRYYYRTSLEDLLLVNDSEKPGRWKEVDPKGKVSGYMTLNCNGKSLSGNWSSPDGSKTLPVSAEVQEGDTFSKPRLEGLKTKVMESGEAGGSKYEIFFAQGFDSVKGLRLAGDAKAVADINKTLMERFTGSLVEAIDCKAMGRLQRGEGDNGYTYELETSVIAWNRDFVVIGEKTSQYCGGIHPLYGAGATTYNLQTGGEEDLSQWLTEPYRKEIPEDSPLGKLIMKTYNPDEECLDAVEFSGDGIWPTPEGMIFRPSAPYAATACIEDVTLSYESLAPFLSPAGKTKSLAFQRR